MKTMIIREFGDYSSQGSYIYNLAEQPVKDCTGCWSCWWRTPGRCIHKDLNEFYEEYLKADKVTIFSKLSLGFVSGNLKTLFDRLIPMALPYIEYSTGESMHRPRYDKYPEIEVYYEGKFMNQDEELLYRDYLARVFYQFHTGLNIVKPISEYRGGR